MLKRILDSLKAEDKQAILFAFEHGLTYFVEYKPLRFLGVNTSKVAHLRPEITAGVWAEGNILRN